MPATFKATVQVSLDEAPAFLTMYEISRTGDMIRIATINKNDEEYCYSEIPLLMFNRILKTLEIE